ncbi:MAG: phosphotransferase [Mariprofundus sp.]|nr:phosphotransferase [Mariprofundus sp.]
MFISKTMPIPKTISDNLRFLLVEVRAQQQYLQTWFDYESAGIAERIFSRRGYTHNLALRIQNSCAEHMLQQVHDDKQSPAASSDSMRLRAMASMAADLERMADLSRDCMHQLQELRPSHRLNLSAYLPLLDLVATSIDVIEDAVLDRDTELALKLGRLVSRQKSACQKLLKKTTAQLQRRKYTDDLVTGLFVAYSIKQMGDVLLKISESIIATNMGQPMDMQRLHSLQETISDWADDVTVADVDIRQVAETRSGSGISAINYTDGDQGEHLAIFKDGEKRKLKEELEGVKRWHHLVPGIAPQILRYKKNGDSATLLIEHLQGVTFEHVVLHESIKTMSACMQALAKTLYSAWGNTRKKKIVAAEFIAQTRKRLADVYAIHPDFRRSQLQICGTKIGSFASLLNAAEKIEKQFPPPFSVLIHGDFNVDNIIYDPQKDHIHFIDLHRSTHMDYVQDVSVLMVSYYRLQVLDAPIRRRISKQVIDFYHIARRFAEAEHDSGFEVRLALGLARSFVTSTRFIMDQSMAARMFLRADYLLRQVIAIDVQQTNKYKVPVRRLFGG